MSTTVLTISNILIFLVTLLVNKLGSSGYFNNMGQKDVSEKYKTLITANGFAFAIWGVIYSLLFATLIYFFIKRNDPAVTELIYLTSALFIASSFFNIGWIISFSYEKLGLSTVLIFGMLFSLMTIIARIYDYRANFPSTLAGTAFTLYASWVFIASILNISLFLVQKKWDGFNVSKSIWTIIILFTAMAMVTGYLFLYQNALFPVALAWAFFGIYSSYKNIKTNPEMASTIKKVLLLGIAVFIALTIFTFVNNGFAIFPPIMNS